MIHSRFAMGLAGPGGTGPLGRLLAGLAGLGLFLLLGAGPGWAGDKLSVAGSTSLLPMVQKAAEAFMGVDPQAEIAVAGRGSGDGFRAVLEGLADLAGVSRQLRPSELDLAKKRGKKLHLVPVALGCVVPVVDPANPVKALSLEQLRQIYSGEITNWKQLGGRDQPIAVMSRDSNSGTFEIFREAVMGPKRVLPRALLLASNGAMVQAVSGNPRAIGYVGLGYMCAKLRGLTVNGLEPRVDTVKSGAYPLSRRLYMVLPGPPTGLAGRFLDFLLGPAGRAIASQEGLVPL